MPSFKDSLQIKKIITALKCQKWPQNIKFKVTFEPFWSFPFQINIVANWQILSYNLPHKLFFYKPERNQRTPNEIYVKSQKWELRVRLKIVNDKWTQTDVDSFIRIFKNSYNILAVSWSGAKNSFFSNDPKKKWLFWICKMVN